MIPPLNITAYKLHTTRNAYGDFVSTGSTQLRCHFRYIVDQVSGSNETTNADAMAWFEPDSGVDRKDILLINDEYFRVERVIKAIGLRSPDVKFIKVELLRYGTIS